MGQLVLTRWSSLVNIWTCLSVLKVVSNPRVVAAA